ncbi:MAG: RDD family protein [Planctomycetota bacterium]
MRTNALQIRTPEGVVFSQLLAGPVVRSLAWAVDFFCIVTVLRVASALLLILNVFGPDVAQAATILAYFAGSIGYGMACEWLWRGQTVGKRLLRLRVVDAEGLRLQFGQIALRNLLRAVDSLPGFYLVGGAAAWLSRKSQRLGDMAANTAVIRIPRVAQPDLEQLLAGKYNSLRGYPHLEARLRQRVTPAEAAMALQTLLRRDDFDPKARVRLFELLATRFRDKVRFPAEATEGIGDEQYVRNVVDVLYRARRRDEAPSNAETGPRAERVPRRSRGSGR